MDQNIENKLEFKYKILNFYNNNKKKLYVIFFIFISIIISILFLKNSLEKKNIYIAEKYIQANLYLRNNESEKATILFEEILESKNKFYSILSLNTIIEKELILDKIKILEFFSILEKNIKKGDQKDLITFKKALYLINMSDIQKGNDLLNKLIDDNSTLKVIAEEVLNKNG